MKTPISVVIPTRDRADALHRCVTAIARERAAGVEVVVVDDCSRDRAAVANAVSELGRVRIVRGPGRGPAAARNLGVRAAGGEVVCFVDDDCEPGADWATLLAEAATPGGAAAGRTVSPPGAGRTVVAAQTITNYVQLASGNQARVGEPQAPRTLAFAPTCNLAIRRADLLKLPFDESYPFAAGEDRDWCARALAAGLVIEYVPDAVVVHDPELDLRGFLRQQYRYGRGAARYRAGSGDRGLYQPRFYAGLLRRGMRQGAGVGLGIAIAQAATAVGVAAERLSRWTRA